jgi:hypothetical protein
MNGVACDALDHPAEGPKDNQNCRCFHFHFLPLRKQEILSEVHAIWITIIAMAVLPCKTSSYHTREVQLQFCSSTVGIKHWDDWYLNPVLPIWSDAIGAYLGLHVTHYGDGGRGWTASQLASYYPLDQIQLHLPLGIVNTSPHERLLFCISRPFRWYLN